LAFTVPLTVASVEPIPVAAPVVAVGAWAIKGIPAASKIIANIHGKNVRPNLYVFMVSILLIILHTHIKPFVI
jgi:hypothetical protein